MPDPVEALQATARLLKAGGKIYVTQTFQRRGAFLLASIKVRHQTLGALTTSITYFSFYRFCVLHHTYCLE